MKNVNETYKGAGGSSLNNCIQGFHEKRKKQKVTVFGKLMNRFGSSIKEMFVQTIAIDDYTFALLDLIQQTYYIEEWLSCVLALSKQKQEQNEQFSHSDKTSLENLRKISKFLQDVVMVIVLNDLKYLLSFI